VATRSEAKLAFWEASAKDDAAREALTKWLADNSRNGPGGFVPDEVVAALKAKPEPKSKPKKAVKR